MERRHSLITHNDRFPNVADPHLTPAAQREACEAYVVSQRHAGWVALAEMYDDGGLSGGTMERPVLKRLLEDIKADKVQIVVVYKVDRLARSLSDFAKIIAVLDAPNASFVSVTQQFNTTTIHGASDAQHAVIIRPIRARDRRRAHPRQDRGVETQGHVDALIAWMTTRPALRLRTCFACHFPAQIRQTNGPPLSPWRWIKRSCFL
jgi:hypothetical protein